MLTETLRGKVGAPVTGQDEFFDREKELSQLIEKIERGDSVYISAPRRIGKTSLMHKAEEELTKTGHTCLFFDLEGYLTPYGWISDWFVKAVSGKETKLTDKVSMVLKDECRDKVCTCEDATKIYLKKIVRGQEGNYQLNHLEERLRKIFSEREYTLAMQILSYLSAIDEAVKGKELIERAKSERYHVDCFQNIMQNLEHDGYIEKLENGWGFRSRLLKDWWRYRYGDA